MYDGLSLGNHQIAHVRYKLLLKFQNGSEAKLQFFTTQFFRIIPRRVLGTKKTKPNIYRTCKMTRKPWSHVRILIHRTWAIATALTCRPAQEPTEPWHSKHCLVHDSLHFYQMCAGETNQCFHFGIVVFVFLLKKKKRPWKRNCRLGELLRVWDPFPLKDKKMLKYIPCLGQQPQFHYPACLGQRRKCTPSCFSVICLDCFCNFSTWSTNKFHLANQFNRAGIT